jgi:two-component system, OmpR family, response regulator PrrA
MGETIARVSNARVLVVDDDEAIVDSLRRGLELEGYSVITAPDGSRALEAVSRGGIDAVVLDIGLPDLSGRVVAARMRAGGLETPILVLSALDQVDDRVAGLEAGADDYLVKPFAMDELVARLRALLRRAAHNTERVNGVDPPLRLGALLIDVSAASATWDGRDLGLTRRELELLAALARNSEVVLSRDRLLELVWGYDFAPDSRALDVFISYLRKKLETAGAPRILETVRGVGFVLRRS